jgi:GDP-mannose 6-dehydrogenase
MTTGSCAPAAASRPLAIAIFGLGYVGVTTAACLLRDGHRITGVDVNPEKVALIGQGRSPVVEPEVEESLQAGHGQGRLTSTLGIGPWLDGIDLALVCVGTPSRAGGRLDLAHLLEVTRQLGTALRARRAARPLLLVFRSTLPPGTMQSLVLPTLEATSGRAAGDGFEVACNPEFLRESTAVRDYFSPPKIVIGERAPGLTRRLLGIYDGLEAPVFEVPFRVAEAVKFVDNSFHALKVAFANEIGRICQAQGIDPQAVTDVFLADTKLNISAAYLRPGGPYGGSCLPKDLGAMIALAREHGVAAPLLEGVRASNAAHLDHLVRLVRETVPPPGPVLQLGLSFKPGTDDLRNSPLVDLAAALLKAGYELVIFDPDVDPVRLLGANFALAAEHRGTLLGRLTRDLDGALAEVRLVVVGKPLRAAVARIPADKRRLDATRLEGPP